MNNSTRHSGIIKKKTGQVLLAIALATVIGGAPAFADGHDNRDHDQGRGHHRHHHHQTYYEYPGYYPYYEQPVYAPPPIYYAPEPSPGINLFFPIHIH
jgi:hypothetical protein